jgi:hypothetical protein
MLCRLRMRQKKLNLGVANNVSSNLIVVSYRIVESVQLQYNATYLKIKGVDDNFSRRCIALYIVATTVHA